jgi:hypothetical protein
MVGNLRYIAKAITRARANGSQIIYNVGARARGCGLGITMSVFTGRLSAGGWEELLKGKSKQVSTLNVHILYIGGSMSKTGYLHSDDSEENTLSGCPSIKFTVEAFNIRLS